MMASPMLVLLLSMGAAPVRVAILAGNNVGMPHEGGLRYAERDAEKMAHVLDELGGFAPENIVRVLGETPTELRDALDAIPEDALAFVYFSGHSDGTHFHMAGKRIDVDEVRRALQKRARVSILVIDACKSGAAIREKGASLGPAYEIRLVENPEVKGQIVVTSSSHDEVAQESDEIGGSFFTHHWVSGLYGGADANADGIVTLEEAYRFAHYKTVEHTIQSRAGVQHPAFRMDLFGEGSVVLANLRRSTARIRVAAGQKDGAYFILDGEKQLVLTELQGDQDGMSSVQLPPGHYRVQKREADRVLLKDVRVRAGDVAIVRDVEMRASSYTSHEEKGGGSSSYGHGPFVLGGARSSVHRLVGMLPELHAGYRVRVEWLVVEPRFVFRRGTASDGILMRYSEFDVGLSAGVSFSHARWRWEGGVDVGYVAIDDVIENIRIARDFFGGSRDFGLTAGLWGAANFHVFGGFGLRLRANVSVLDFRVDGRASRPVTGGVALGMIYEFGH